MKHLRVSLASLVLLLSTVAALGAGSDDGFVPLTDGKSFAGWTAAKEHPDTWMIEDGAFVAHGERCHLFYTGDQAPFRNFELKVEVMTDAGSNGGIYFHTQYQAEGWPTAGFETQVNNSHTDWKRTGSIYDVANVGLVAAEDGKWWTQHIIVQGNKVTVKVDDRVVVQYTEPPGAQPGSTFARKLGTGTFALQAHDPKSVVRYRNIRVKRLPD